VWTAQDVIAERIRALGYVAPFTHERFHLLTQIREAKTVPSATEMVVDLMHDHELLINSSRCIVPIAADAQDETTIDLVTQRLSSHEKNAWMLRSILGS
jgi:starvation-inducible DNA-binding protein